MADNDNLSRARKAKQDEFYTRLDDINEELKHYWSYFKGARILCNCDDPRVSNFVRYFVMRFDILGLKHITATCWKNTNPDLFSQGKEDHAVRLDWDETLPPYRGPDDFSRIPCERLVGDGDFRSDEVKTILAESDVVVTNPPFSLFREYVTQLVESGKKFLIIGNKNAITYREVFSLIKDNKLWTGTKPMSSEMYFDVPQSFIDNALAMHKDRTVIKYKDKYVARTQSVWFTNLDIEKRHDHFETGASYGDGSGYKHYDNYDAIEVPATRYVPTDYDGPMGVPITFLDRYNPDEYELLGMDRDFTSDGGRFKVTDKGVQKTLYARLVIKKRH